MKYIIAIFLFLLLVSCGNDDAATHSADSTESSAEYSTASDSIDFESNAEIIRNIGIDVAIDSDSNISTSGLPRIPIQDERYFN